MSDVPLGTIMAFLVTTLILSVLIASGFGVTSRSTNEVRSSDTEAIVVFHQADIGEYLREEADII